MPKLVLILSALLSVSALGTASANPVTVAIGESGTQIEAGAENTSKDGLNAEVGELWGVSNSSSRDAMVYFTYSVLADASIPSTIQAGTYTLSARIGSGTGSAFSGLNDITAGANTDQGSVAGFFTTLDGNAEAAKNNMVTEFNAQAGVTYTQPTEEDPASGSFTTWTFIWTVEPGSPVIGTDPFLGVYTKLPAGGGNGFWDDSTLSYSSLTPANSISVNFHADDADALAEHQLAAGETAGLTPLDGSHWNNINLGTAQTNSGATIFSPTSLSDELGNSSAATISSIPTSGSSGSWFVGYAASSASDSDELTNGISDDNLYNSYLATNASDNFSLSISGLGTDFTTEGYSLIIYSDSDRRNTTSNARQSLYTVTPSGGSPITGFVEDDDGATVVNIFDGTYLESDGVEDGDDYSNYVVISGLNASDFTLEIDSPDGGRGAISGFQIVGQGSVGTIPVINDFSADIDTLTAPGTTVTLSWDVAEVTTLSISPDIGDVLPSTVKGIGQTTVIVDAATTFTLTASNDTYTVSSEVVISAPLPTVNFTADDTYVPPSELVVLSWQVSDADSVILSGVGNVSPIDSTTVNPAENTTYTLAATNAFGTIEEEVTVRVGPERLNILLMLVDDYGPMDSSVLFAYDHYDDTGAPLTTAFNNYYRTPNMESLASTGMKFTQAYAMPMCSPTRVSLMTGLNSPRHGVTVHLNALSAVDNASFSVKTHRGPNNWRWLGMDGTDTTLPQLLKDIGYHTFFVGKDHMSKTQGPTAIGFDVSDSALYKSTALTPKATTMIENAVNAGDPFFGYISYQDVHAGFYFASDVDYDYSQATPPAHNLSHEKFSTMVESVDNSLGTIVAKLNELGVADDTLIIFLGDNGSDSPALSDEFGANGTNFDDFPMRGKKGSAYEGGIRVPFYVSWAARDDGNSLQQNLPIPAASVEHDIITVEDVAPTILALLDQPSPGMDGYDLTPYLRAEVGTHRPQKVLRHMPHEHRSNYFTAFRDGDWKIIYRYHMDGAVSGTNEDVNKGHDTLQLFNLAADPYEETNLAISQPEKLLTMARAMARELDSSWGIYGPLWPVHNPSETSTPARPLVDDPFFIDFDLHGLELVDADADGLADANEDIDGNGLVGSAETDSDDWDTDGDNTDDFSETRLGLDPIDANSAFTVKSTFAGDSSLNLKWPSTSGLYFNIRSSNDLSDPVEIWDILFPAVPANETLSETTQDVLIDSDKKFFSVELLP
ncbi:MAG: sulfatase-like hydrolase/transferase [Akkermansiaceae bacterium]|nr:sulfatase-like hydrolase/transferase [Akkermansiaceae bacterium]